MNMCNNEIKILVILFETFSEFLKTQNVRKFRFR